MTGDEVVRAVTGAVGHLRLTVGPLAPEPTDGAAPGGGGWTSCRRLLDDPPALAELVAGTREGRGTDRDDVAMSLFVQAYAYRVAAAAIGGWLLTGAVLDVSPDGTAISLGRDRPNALLLHEARVVETDDAIAALHDVLVDQHLAPMVGSARVACRIGRPLLWGNVASSIASSFGAFQDALGDRPGGAKARLDEFLTRARPELAGAGRAVTVGRRWAWERSSCCLWYRTERGSRCEDCSLWTDDERRQRYAAAIEAEARADADAASAAAAAAARVPGSGT